MYIILLLMYKHCSYHVHMYYVLYICTSKGVKNNVIVPFQLVISTSSSASNVFKPPFCLEPVVRPEFPTCVCSRTCTPSRGIHFKEFIKHNWGSRKKPRGSL